jgi:LPXTG-site transpeptidase (sortase) family protein
MVKKILAAVLLVVVFIALTVKPVTARPPYAFGGGERVIHINDNAPAGTTPTHVNTTPQDYEYGAFLGVLTVERLGRTVNVYGGATMEAMDFGAGHFSFTGLNEGNVGLIGHNRGRAGFFSFVRLLREGDIITLDMGGIVRTYAVSFTSIVDETDFSYLQQFGINRLTLVTCVEYVRNQRRIAVAEEVSRGCDE